VVFAIGLDPHHGRRGIRNGIVIQSNLYDPLVLQFLILLFEFRGERLLDFGRIDLEEIIRVEGQLQQRLEIVFGDSGLDPGRANLCRMTALRAGCLNQFSHVLCSLLVIVLAK